MYNREETPAQNVRIEKEIQQRCDVPECFASIDTLDSRQQYWHDPFTELYIPKEVITENTYKVSYKIDNDYLDDYFKTLYSEVALILDCPEFDQADKDLLKSCKEWTLNEIQSHVESVLEKVKSYGHIHSSHEHISFSIEEDLSLYDVEFYQIEKRCRKQPLWYALIDAFLWLGCKWFSDSEYKMIMDSFEDDPESDDNTVDDLQYWRNSFIETENQLKERKNNSGITYKDLDKLLDSKISNQERALIKGVLYLINSNFEISNYEGYFVDEGIPIQSYWTAITDFRFQEFVASRDLGPYSRHTWEYFRGFFYTWAVDCNIEKNEFQTADYSLIDKDKEYHTIISFITSYTWETKRFEICKEYKDDELQIIKRVLCLSEAEFRSLHRRSKFLEGKRKARENSAAQNRKA